MIHLRAALVMPVVSIDALNNKHLAEISGYVSPGAIALLIRADAGWPSSPNLIRPENIVLMPRPSYPHELNSGDPSAALRAIQGHLMRFAQDRWDYPRGNFLSHCVWDTYAAILDACCDAGRA